MGDDNYELIVSDCHKAHPELEKNLYILFDKMYYQQLRNCVDKRIRMVKKSFREISNS